MNILMAPRQRLYAAWLSDPISDNDYNTTLEYREVIHQFFKKEKWPLCIPAG